MLNWFHGSEDEVLCAFSKYKKMIGKGEVLITSRLG